MKSKLMSVLIIYFLSLITLASCSEDDTTVEKVSIGEFRAQVEVSLSVGDNGNPSDWEFTISPPMAADMISEYRLFYEVSTASIDTSATSLVSLKSLASDKYTSLSPDDLGSSIRLNSEQLSITSVSIDLSKKYTLYALSIGEFNGQEVLTICSATLPPLKLKLNIEDFTVSDIEVEDIRNSGNSSDITVSFSGAQSQDDVQEYRIVGAKSNSSLTLDQVKSMDAGRLVNIKNDDSKSYVIELPADLLDADGEAFQIDNEYEFYVMTVGSFNEESVFALSSSSPSIELVQKTETTTLVTDFRGNGSIEIDSDGNIYVNEFGEGSGNAGLGTSAFKITPTGEVEEFVSNLSGPVGNTLDNDGNYYVNNGNEGNEGDFLQIAPDGTQTVLATIEGYPTDILTGVDGNFYIANWTKPTIHKVTADGTLTDFVSDQRLAGCTGITYDDNQNILVGNFSSGLIMSIDDDGVITEIATIPTVVNGFVIGYIDYFEGHVYATGYGSNKIYKVSLSGNVEEFAGTGSRTSKDGELDKASFVTPNGIAIDESRRILYISQNFLGDPTSLRAIPLD